jgi:hypothetical protein
MPAKLAQLQFEPVEEISEMDSVCHFDEIDESLQATVADAEAGGRATVTVDPFQAALVDECGCDVVRFTDYYRLSRV